MFKTMKWDAKRRVWVPGLSRFGFLVVIFCALLAFGAVTQIDLTTQVKGILGSANGGTGNGYTKFSGPGTAEKTFTLPNASATILTDNAAVTAGQGGTGQTSATDGSILIGTGTAFALSALLDCVGANKGLNYTAATKTFSCQTSFTGATFADNETPTGTINGSNDTFTVANTPNPAGSLHLYKNGQLMIAGGADYTLATATITFAAGAIPKTGDVLTADYRY